MSTPRTRLINLQVHTIGHAPRNPSRSGLKACQCLTENCTYMPSQRLVPARNQAQIRSIPRRIWPENQRESQYLEHCTPQPCQTASYRGRTLPTSDSPWWRLRKPRRPQLYVQFWRGITAEWRGSMKFSIRTVMLTTLAMPALLLAQPQPNPTTQGVRVKSPEVSADNHVTFRLYGPDAAKVLLEGSWLGAIDIPMTKGADGVWSKTVGPLNPQLYGYWYIVDGVRT